jgi:hypothetical protein
MTRCASSLASCQLGSGMDAQRGDRPAVSPHISRTARLGTPRQRVQPRRRPQTGCRPSRRARRSKSGGRLACPIQTGEMKHAQNQCPARKALAPFRRMAGDPNARAGVQALENIFQLLPRCQPTTELAASARSRRSGWRIFAGQLPLAGCSPVSMDATRLRGRDGWCYGRGAPEVSATPARAPGAPPRSPGSSA